MLMKLIEFREEEYDKIIEKAKHAKMTVKEIKEFLYELFMALCEYDKEDYSDEDFEEEYEDGDEESEVSYRTPSYRHLHDGQYSGMRSNMRRAMRRNMRRHSGRYTY